VNLAAEVVRAKCTHSSALLCNEPCRFQRRTAVLVGTFSVLGRVLCGLIRLSNPTPDACSIHLDLQETVTRSSSNEHSSVDDQTESSAKVTLTS
jgi:hypothetical protein